MVPLIKRGTMLQLTHSMEFYLPKPELVTTISCCQWNQPVFPFFQSHSCLVWIHLWKAFPWDYWSPLYPRLWERSTCGGSFEIQPQNAAMWKSQCSGMLWPFVLPSAVVFFFFLKSCHEGYSYMNLIFKRRGKKKKIPWLSTHPFAGKLFFRQLGQTAAFFFFFFFPVLINIMGHFGNFSYKCTSL